MRRGADSRSESSIAEYYGWDPTLVRLAWVVLSIFPLSILGGVIAYVVAAVIMPDAPAAPVPRPRPAER